MVAPVPDRLIEPTELKLDSVPAATRRAFIFLSQKNPLKLEKWYLAGGTALAFQVGHRQSVDLDFFTPQTSYPGLALERQLLATGQWQTTYQETGTLYGQLYGAKASFIAYPFFRPAQPMLRCGEVRILSLKDIAVMKIIAISQRGRKRDFVDMYWYCQNQESLAEIIPRVLKQYPDQKHNVPHILKSLTYFADAEEDPMPKLFFSADWKTVKAYFQREVPKLARELLGIP